MVVLLVMLVIVIILRLVRKTCFEFVYSLFSEFNDHLITCAVFFRSFQGGLSVFIQLCKGVDLLLVLLLLKVHILEVLGEKFFNFTDPLLHGLVFDPTLPVLSEQLRVVLKSTATWRAVLRCRQIKHET